MCKNGKWTVVLLTLNHIILTLQYNMTLLPSVNTIALGMVRLPRFWGYIYMHITTTLVKRVSFVFRMLFFVAGRD